VGGTRRANGEEKVGPSSRGGPGYFGFVDGKGMDFTINTEG
jgi:hypothetical protein